MLPLQGSLVLFLVGELRSRMTHGVAKKKEDRKKGNREKGKKERREKRRKEGGREQVKKRE